MKEDWGPVAVLSKGDVELWISGPANSAGKTAIDGRTPAPGASNRLVVIVEDLPARVESLKAADVPFMSDLVRGPAGAWIVAADPAGNPVELFEPA